MAKPTNIGTYYMTNDKEKIKFSSDYWWLRPEGNCHEAVFDNSKEYFRKWGSNYFELIGHKNRYEEREVAVGINVSPWSKIRGAKYLSANVTASAVDTLVSLIAKSVPSVQYVTSSGDWYEQQQAKDLEKYVAGMFLNHDVHSELRQMFADTCKVGTGFIVVDDYNGQLCFREFPAYQVMCDWVDAQTGAPVDIHFVEVISRFKLMELYPEHKEKLLKTTNSLHFYTETNLNSKDSVVVIYSYNTFAKRRSICVDNCTLRDDDTLMGSENGLTNYKGETIAPFIYMNYKDTSFGMFSIGVAEELRPLHDSIDKYLRIIQRSAHLGAVPKVFISRQSNIIKPHLDNEIQTIIEYDNMPGGHPPILMPMGKIPTDLWDLVNYQYQLAFKKVGLSEMSATSTKPAGLDSGKALETYFDIQSDRFQATAKKYERAVIDLNYLIIKYSRYMTSMGYKMKAKFYGREIGQVLDFDRVNLDEEYFDIQAYPVSIIPQTPAGRYQTVRDMAEMGLIDQQRALKLLEIPDIEGDLAIQNAPMDYIKFQIYEIMNGSQRFPEKRQNMPMVIDLAEKYYFYYKQKTVPDSALERLSIFIDNAKSLRDREMEDAKIIADNLMQQMQLPEGATA